MVFFIRSSKSRIKKYVDKCEKIAECPDINEGDI